MTGTFPEVPNVHDRDLGRDAFKVFGASADDMAESVARSGLGREPLPPSFYDGFFPIA